LIAVTVAMLGWPKLVASIAMQAIS